MSKSVHRPLYEGVQELQGLWFDGKLYREELVRNRILNLWRPGSQLYKIFDGYFLKFDEKSYWHCSKVPGLAIVESGGIYSSAPLSDEEIQSATRGDFCLISGSRISTLPLAKAVPVDPSQWLDLSRVLIRKVVTLNSDLIIDAGVDNNANQDIRTIFGDVVPSVGKEQKAFIASSLARLNNEFVDDGVSEQKALKKKFAELSMYGIGSLALFFNSFLQGASNLSASEYGVASGKVSAGKPSFLMDKLAAFAEKIAQNRKLAQILGKRQAGYLNNMLQMFERGDFQEALRHAIPLGSLNAEKQRRALGLPRRRQHLTIGKNSSDSGIFIENELEVHLRKVYRKTFERLDQEGRVDEAAFVLAELLKSGEEAAIYLETKGRIEQAAKLADAMELAVDLRIRLWFLACDVHKALSIARLHHRFQELVSFLERKERPEAIDLRRTWAHTVAQRGELTEAAEIIWALQDEREQALQWLELAESAGGILGVRSLLKKLTMNVATLKDSEKSIQSILSAEGEAGALIRAYLAAKIIEVKPSNLAIERLASEVFRRVFAERNSGFNRLSNSELRQLLSYSNAKVLIADIGRLKLPKDTVFQNFISRKSQLESHIEERGFANIEDVIRMPDGSFLLALGETGVGWYSRSGKRLASYAVPAFRFVLADNAQKILIIALRGASVRVTLLEWATRTMKDLQSLPLSFWSDRFDGIHWNVVMDNRLLAIDTESEDWKVVWRVADLPGRIISFRESEREQTLLITGADGLHQWRYQLPDRRLSQRDIWDSVDSDIWRVVPVDGADEPAKLYLLNGDNKNTLKVSKTSLVTGFEVDLGSVTQEPKLMCAEGMLLVAFSTSAGQMCEIRHLLTGNCIAKVEFKDSELVCWRIQPDFIILFDRLGRLMEIERKTGIGKIHLVN